VTLLLGALTIGLLLSVLALGILISYRVMRFADITADGSLTLGAALAAVLLAAHVDPFLATAAAALAGALAGATTAFIHTRFGVDRLLSGILVMTALYSVNLTVMGKSNIALLSETTLASRAGDLGLRLFHGKESGVLWGWEVNARDVALLVLSLAAAAFVAFLLWLFLKTELGTALRATGDNPQMIRALGVDVDRMVVLGLALSNALVAVSGALLAQYQGFADAQMGVGMMVLGLASVIIGEALTGGGTAPLGPTLAGTLIGSVLFRLLVAIALRWGLNPNQLKLITAVFVLGALVLPSLPGLLARRARARSAS
jgi:putative ABC transport system permease protein